ncbi:MAG: FAD-dependent oxidoreductase [Alicyclobacillaceae bacterium]|nr:FAD-dependent oxidoreductase [Alicyclobacillaceae bacterium]
MHSPTSIVIVGAGVAGVQAVETLRREGYEGALTVVDKAAEIPYDRPPLSKEFLAGTVTAEDIALRSPGHWNQWDVDLRLTVEATQIDPREHTLTTASGDVIAWDKVLLATGSTLRELKVPGITLDGVFYLKTLDDAARLRAALSEVQELVVVGAGFIGAEVASTCRKRGLHVTVLEMMKYPLAHILGEDLGHYFARLHEAHDVDLRTEESIVAVHGKTRVESVETSKGQTISCQAVVVGVGVMANTPILHEQLEVSRGYVVDAFGRTSLPDVFAAGDCTVWPYRGHMIHVEHWDHAVQHAKTVARNMLAEEMVPYDTVPYFWSDQYGNRYQYVGHAAKWSQTVTRGSQAEHRFTQMYLDEENRLLAALVANRPKDVMSLRRLIDARRPVDRMQLENEALSFTQL